MKIFGFLFLLITLFITPLVHAERVSCGGIFMGDVLIPFLEVTDLSSLKPLARGNFEALKGADKVFIKRLRGGSDKEAQWMQYLNGLGLGAQLHGLLKLPGDTSGSLYMVIENLPGVSTQIPMMAPEGFRLTKEIGMEMRRQANLLASQGVIPVDLQFQVSAEGKAKIIDPELFRRATTVEAAQKETGLIVQNIMMAWAMESKLDL